LALPLKPSSGWMQALVTVDDGTGHHRDMDLLVYETDLGDQISQRKIAFVDLNRDELIKTKLQATYSGLGICGFHEPFSNLISLSQCQK
jgi:hypothetical protein